MIVLSGVLHSGRHTPMSVTGVTGNTGKITAALEAEDGVFRLALTGPAPVQREHNASQDAKELERARIPRIPRRECSYDRSINSIAKDGLAGVLADR